MSTWVTASPSVPHVDEFDAQNVTPASEACAAVALVEAVPLNTSGIGMDTPLTPITCVCWAGTADEADVALLPMLATLETKSVMLRNAYRSCEDCLNRKQTVLYVVDAAGDETTRLAWDDSTFTSSPDRSTASLPSHAAPDFVNRRTSHGEACAKFWPVMVKVRCDELNRPKASLLVKLLAAVLLRSSLGVCTIVSERESMVEMDKTNIWIAAKM